MSDIVKILNVEEFGALSDDAKVEYLVAVEAMGQLVTVPVVELAEFLRSGIMKAEWEAHNATVEAKVTQPFFLATTAGLTDAVWSQVMGDAEPKFLADVQVGDVVDNKTTSGDDKGESLSITSNDVGDLGAVLGNATNVDVSAPPVPAPIPDTSSVSAPEGVTGTTAIAAPAPAPVPEAPVAVSTTQLKTIQPAPAKAVVVAEEKPAPAPLKTIQPGVVVKATAAPADETPPEVAAAMKVASMQTQSALAQIQEYMRDMHPAKPNNAKSIEQHQVKLMYALYTALTAEDQHFATVWKAIIAIAKQHRDGAFKVTARNRGLNSISLATIDNKMMRFLTRVIDLLAVQTGINDLATVKQHVDFAKLIESVTHHKAKQNLTAFYSA